jgi:hypothetical protein
MKRILSESTMLLLEQKEGSWGCGLFPEDTEDREWCSYSMERIKHKKVAVQKQIDKISELFKLPEYSDLSKNIKRYSQNDSFYQENKDNMNKLYTRLNPDCPEKVKSAFANFKSKLANQYLFVDKMAYKEKYNSINKLNTNHSALAYLLTLYRRDNKMNLYNDTFNVVFDKFFVGGGREDRMDENPFVKLIVNYYVKKDNAVNIMKNVFNTIKSTTKIGETAEREAFIELRKKYKRVDSFSGDFSWVDLMGVDIMIYDNGWIPVQIKNNFKDCFGNHRFCKNICMGKDRGDWRYEYYEGGNITKRSE